MRTRQGGVTTVEFAIIGALLLTVMFAVLEFGRALFSFAVLNEATRRGARAATICGVQDAKITQAVLFAPVPKLSASNVAVEYLDQAGAVIADPNANFTQIRYVRVRIVNYQLPLAIPFFNFIISTPQFATTLPRESLGIPREGQITPCGPP